MSKLFTQTLLQWHNNNPRDLVWKKDKDAYSIWLSEIIMQQTRVAYGSKYYTRFKQLFPTIQKLAKADLSEVIKAWEGLGYYSRARNLHATAKRIVNEYHGEFPSDYKALQQLKGVGPYTAAAIASFAFGQPIAAIDGNAYRVLARYFGISTPIDAGKGKQEFQQLGNQLISKQEPGKFNQAMMNFGALVCTPKQPKCTECPLESSCYANEQGMQLELPVKAKAIKRKQRYFTYFFIYNDNEVLLQERVLNDVWKNLNQFYLIESPRKTKWETILNQSTLAKYSEEFTINKVIKNTKQQLSHQTISVDFVSLYFTELPPLKGFQKVAIKELSEFAFPKVLNVILKKVLT